jgi:ribonuclease P protein component
VQLKGILFTKVHSATFEKRREKMKYLRLKKQSDFQKLFSSGKRLFSPSLTMIVKPSKAMTMGISIGKKHGKAVQRNHIKRLLREAFMATQESMKNTYSVVLIPKVAENYSYHTYKKELEKMIAKGGL